MHFLRKAVYSVAGSKRIWIYQPCGWHSWHTSFKTNCIALNVECRKTSGIPLCMRCETFRNRVCETETWNPCVWWAGDGQLITHNAYSERLPGACLGWYPFTVGLPCCCRRKVCIGPARLQCETAEREVHQGTEIHCKMRIWRQCALLVCIALYQAVIQSVYAASPLNYWNESISWVWNMFFPPHVNLDMN